MRGYWNKVLAQRLPAPNWWRTRYPWLTLAVAIAGLILTTTAWFAVSRGEDTLAASELSSSSEGHARNLQVGINAYLRKVAALRALFESADENVSRAEFYKFTKQLMSDQNSILGMSWFPRVARDQREAHERAAKHDGLPDYRIKSVDPDGNAASSAEQNEYFPVYYTTDRPGLPIYGLDLNNGGLRQKTLELARDSNAFATSSMFKLQSGTGFRRGFLVVLPVYAPDVPHDTLEERKRNLRGYVGAAFQTSMLIESILNATRRTSGLDLYFYPTDAGRHTSELIYFHGSRSRVEPVEPLPRSELSAGPHWIGKLDVGEARWTMIAVPSPGGPGTATRAGSWMALFFGLFATTMVVGYIWSTGRHGQRLLIANRQLDHTLGTLSTVNDELSAALNNMVQGFIMFDSHQRIAVFNERFIEMYGLSRDIVKPGCSFLKLLEHRAELGQMKIDPQRFHDELLAELAKGKVSEQILDWRDGREIAIISKPMPGGGWVGTHEDITERRRAEAKIAHMALHDGLTGFANRHLFNEELATRFKQLARNQKFAVLCLDLDRFKNVNDTLGHPLGDKLLQQVGARLRLCVREYDTIARLGGDEFAILQGGVAVPAEAKALSERVVEAIGRPFDVDGHHIVIGVSIGVAVAPTDATDVGELLKAADFALLRAKTDGRGTYRFFDAALDGSISARHTMERDLRKALLNDEFVMHYQPLVNLQSGRITAFEGLIRWDHPKHGIILPADFIPLAEETALIVPVGEWALRQACKDAAGWPGAVGVAVNLSSVQFKEHDLCQTITDALKLSGLSPDRLELEITETALLQNQKSILETMRQLHALGVRIAMDDFGTGYSSLSTLRNFPFDKIKIDRSFIHDLARLDSQAILRAVVQLANSLGLDTTAEGVESQEELEYLKRLGCTEGQGYLFSGAVPPKDASTLLTLESAHVQASAA
jgi:diguanylate cyclase (GGDEF)-like protein/PAS domain S-box-containing protein